MLVLSLESSTSSSKALLYDTERGVVGLESEPYDESVCANGQSDTEAVFQHVMRLASRITKGREISAIALSSIWHSISICDDSFKPLTPTYAWNYMEPSAHCKKVRDNKPLASKLYMRTGCMPHIIYMRETLRYFADNGMDLSGRKLISQGAYNLLRLTGEFCESLSTASGSGWMDVKTLKYDDFAMDYTGIKASQLGELVSYKNTFPLNEYGAEMLGVSAGIPVVPSHPDGALNQIANFAADVGRMTLSVGTSGAIRLSTDHPILPDGHQLWSYYGVSEYMSGAAISGACNCINWYVEDVLQNRWSFKELENPNDAPCASVPTFLPFVFGERNPGWRDDRLGGFCGLQKNHSAIEMYRAVQAGILFNLYQCYEILCADVGTPGEIVVSGGILNSVQWTQMLADIFQCTLKCVKNINASSMGAAVLAMHAAGAIEDIKSFRRDYDEAVTVQPRTQYKEYYKEQYDRYSYWYNGTQGL
ncbi:MAG: FGGY-family carbohydrate kinase [Oscillospiraceae bacterium]